MHTFYCDCYYYITAVPWPTDNFPFLKRFVQWNYSRSDKGKNFAVMVRATKEWLAKKKQARTAQKVFNTACVVCSSLLCGNVCCGNLKINQAEPQAKALVI